MRKTLKSLAKSLVACPVALGLGLSFLGLGPVALVGTLAALVCVAAVASY